MQPFSGGREPQPRPPAAASPPALHLKGSSHTLPCLGKLLEGPGTRLGPGLSFVGSPMGPCGWRFPREFSRHICLRRGDGRISCPPVLVTSAQNMTPLKTSSILPPRPWHTRPQGQAWRGLPSAGARRCLWGRDQRLPPRVIWKQIGVCQGARLLEALSDRLPCPVTEGPSLPWPSPGVLICKMWTLNLTLPTASSSSGVAFQIVLHVHGVARLL